MGGREGGILDKILISMQRKTKFGVTLIWQSHVHPTKTHSFRPKRQKMRQQSEIVCAP